MTSRREANYEPLRVPVSDADHLRGNENADCVLVEYGDYQCPHCRAAHPVVARLQHHFGDRLLYVYRNFPLTNIHPFAEAAAEAAEFAGDRGAFWEMHDLIFRNQDRLGLPLLSELIQQLGLDTAELENALQEGVYTEKVQSDFSGGVRSGVNGTPTFFINGTRHNGPNDYNSLSEAMTAALQPDR